MKLANKFNVRNPEPTDRHYSVAEIAGMWNISPDFVRKIFGEEQGVLILENVPSSYKRRYTTLRIPESVVLRVHQRLSIPKAGA